MRRVSRPFPISVKVVYRPAFCLPAPRCTLEKPQKQMESWTWKNFKNTSKVWNASGEKAGVMQGDSGRAEQMNGKGGAKIHFSSHGLTLSGSEWPLATETCSWLQKPAASVQVARVVREYSSTTEALLGWGADKKQDWQLIFSIHSLTSPPSSFPGWGILA